VFRSGIEEGRKDATSVDGAQVPSTAEEIFRVGTITAIAIQQVGLGTEVSLECEHTSEQAVHLIGVGAGALLIDGEGFSTGLTIGNKGKSTSAIKILPKAKVRQSLVR
jgi:hypothetical protein